MSLTLQDKKYIDTAISKSRIEFKNDMVPFFERIMQENRDHMLTLKESFQDEVKMLAELIQDRPTREEVRGIICEEVEPLRRDLTHHILSHS
ncbi:MAG: hypothetical protein AB197_00915 [Parcubacteria bacterium C7867-002]|nr:MAG: hypothetical protein AB197_00915 [Parcubacteria bacterium C7867-002]